jgi:hypothetical protein
MGNRRIGTRRLEAALDNLLGHARLGGLNGSPFSLKDPDRVCYEECFTQLPKVNGFLVGSETKDFGEIADGADLSEDIVVTGAAMGDFATVSIGVDIVDLIVTAQVTATNTVTVNLENQSGGAIDLASTTLAAMVVKRDVGQAGNSHANPNFEVLGTNATSDDIAFATTTAGILLQPDGANGDQLILAPHLDSNQSSWTGTKWGTENQVHWECAIRTDAADIDDTTIWAGLKLTNTPTMATDADQAYFIYGAEDDDAGALATNANLHFVYSVGGTDFVTDLGIVVAAATDYRLGIQIDSDRKISAWVNGVQYGLTVVADADGIAVSPASGVESSLSSALTDDIDLIPYIGIMNQDATTRDMVVYYQKMSRIFFE